MCITVEVTAADIAGGRGLPTQRCWTCPVAQAIKRVLPRGVEFRGVGFYYAHFRFRSTPVPETATAFMEALDAGQKVEPFVFDLDVPVWESREKEVAA